MVFKDKKIPKHLIIQDEYEVRHRHRFGFIKFVTLTALLISLTWAVSTGLVPL